MNIQYLFIFFILWLTPHLAFADLWESRRMEKKKIELEEKMSDLTKDERELVENWENQFIRESLHKIHLNLRLAVFMSDYYISCLEKKSSWFEENVDLTIYEDLWFENRRRMPAFSTRTGCARLSSIKKSIKERYPLMRHYLTIVQYRGLGVYGRFSENQFDTNANLNPRAPEQIEISKEIMRQNALSNYHQNKHLLKHTFPGMAKLPPFSTEEVVQAEQLFDKNEFVRKKWSETGTFPKEFGEDPQVVCANPSLTMLVDKVRNCFLEKYKELLVGNQERNIPGLPILGFISSATPTNEELLEGVRQIRKNSMELLREFQEEYFLVESSGTYSLRTRNFSLEANLDIFQFLSKRLRNDRDGYGKLIEAGITQEEIIRLIEIGDKLHEDAVETRMIIEIGVLTGGALACTFLPIPALKTPLGKALCQLPIGLFANAYFFVVDTQAYDEALKIALYRPDGKRSTYQNISELDDYALMSFFSTVMAPFFTGVPALLKYFKKTEFWNALWKKIE